MDAVAAPAVGSEATAGTDQLELSTANERAQEVRRYQPLVVLALAVATGIVWDRFGPQRVFPAIVDSSGGSLGFVIWWCACGACLAIWSLMRRQQRDGYAAWLLVAAAAFAGAAWHELNWF